MQLDPRALHIYTDGSCYRELGRISGCAAIVQFPEHLARPDEQILDFGCSESTINRMELMACIRALEWVGSNSPWPGVSRVQIITDSKYVKDNIPRAATWRSNAWRNRHGEPRENVDLWRRFLSVRQKVRTVVTFEWTLGKKTPILKNIDRAAKLAAKRAGPKSDRGFKPGTVSRSLVKGSAIRFPATGQMVNIRPYRKTLVRNREEKIRFDVFSDQVGEFSFSGYAYATQDVASVLHRQHTYRVRFNNLPDYPQIIEVIEEVSTPNR